MESMRVDLGFICMMYDEMKTNGSVTKLVYDVYECRGSVLGVELN